MNSFGIGVDIEEISRFEKKPFSKNKTFYRKIFTENEIKYCLSKVNPYPSFAARFCAKEATIKATKNQNLQFKDIEIKMENKIPIIEYANNKKSMVSISHTAKYAIAFVIIND